MEQAVADFIEKYGIGLYIPKVHVTDVIEVLILTFLIYQIIVWIKNTKAWMLLRGIIVLAGFILLAAIFKMHTILFIARNSLTVMATAAIVVFQPELRRALEKLGEYYQSLLCNGKSKDRSVDRSRTGNSTDRI